MKNEGLEKKVLKWPINEEESGNNN